MLKMCPFAKPSRQSGFDAIKSVRAHAGPHYGLPYLFSGPKISALHAVADPVIGKFFVTTGAMASRGIAMRYAVGQTE
jgi:hypothetical protein